MEGHQLWSERYDRDMQDVFAIQDDIANSVTDALAARFGTATPSRIVRHYTDNLEAYNLYLRGRHAWASWTPQGLMESIQHFQAALALEPEYALAYSGIADAYTVLASFGYSAPHEIYPIGQNALSQSSRHRRTSGRRACFPGSRSGQLRVELERSGEILRPRDRS